MEVLDLVIRNGRIIDPANNLDIIGDVAVHNGLIYSIESNVQFKARKEFDATGCLVTPGLIDTHIHCYQYATPLGINPDQQCLARGVTTVVDAGSSGCSTFPGLKKFIAEQSKTRVLCFLHIANHGLASAGCAAGAPGGEIDSLNQVDVEACVNCIEANRDIIVGIKLRLSEDISNNGKNEQEAYRRAMEASRLAKVPLMVHHSLSTVPVQASTNEIGCPGEMQKGDFYTHTFHGHKSCIIDPNTKGIFPDVVKARERGVLFDVGHGQGSFNWTVAEMCAKQKFWPDIISTDLHTECHNGPAYDLTCVMSKFLFLGMSLVDIIGAVTVTPARALGWGDRIGSMSVGMDADVTVLRLEDVDLDLEDCQSQRRRMTKLLVPVAVWRRGEQFDVTRPTVFPNVEAMKANVASWNNVLIKDEQKPEF